MIGYSLAGHEKIAEVNKVAFVPKSEHLALLTGNPYFTADSRNLLAILYLPMHMYFHICMYVCSLHSYPFLNFPLE